MKWQKQDPKNEYVETEMQLRNCRVLKSKGVGKEEEREGARGNEKRSEQTGTDAPTRTGRDAITKSVVLVRVRVRLSVNQFRASIPIQRLSYPTETDLPSKISGNTYNCPNVQRLS